MTGTEISLISALCTIGGGVVGVILSKTGKVTIKECELKSGGLAQLEADHYANLKTSMDKVDTKIDGVATKVDNLTMCVFGDPSKGRRSYDKAIANE
jgi:hypothetical protein